MDVNPNYKGYTSFSYLQEGIDYRHYELADELNRVESWLVPLNENQEDRAQRLADDLLMISMHEHLGVFPADATLTPEYLRQGRMATGFRGLAHSQWNAVFDNLMDGLCMIHSSSGWKWTEVLHDLGMRLSDIAHQDFLIRAETVDDIYRAHTEGKIAWIASIEGAAMIENELDRIEILHGFGVRALGVTYSEANALGSGLKEQRDGGLTSFGKKAVRRMNDIGMLIDCSHAGDRTTLDTIAHSTKPIVLTHIGARALWDTRRMAPDDVLLACAEHGGVIGIEAAPNSTLTPSHRRHGIEAFMAHFEYVKDLVGIDHVSFGPDTIYGDHVGIYGVYSSSLSIKESRGKANQNTDASGRASGSDTNDYETIPYVKGLENPTEASYNILRWLVKEDYSDEDIAKVLGENTLRVLHAAWSV